jgi:PAS domain-containing protein
VATIRFRRLHAARLLLQWNQGLVWLHVISDVLIAAASFTIPITLFWLVRKRRDLPFNWIFVLFGIFIIACGATHLMEVWNLARAVLARGWIEGHYSAASVSTAILLAQLIPKALELPNVNEWIHANAALEKEVHERRELEIDLRISEARYREQAELLGLTHDAIFVRNRNSQIIYWNRAEELLSG